MALDTRIPLMVQPVQLPDFNAMAQTRLQNAQNIMAMRQQQQAMRRQELIKQAYASSIDPQTGQPDFKKLVPAIGQIDPALGMQVQTHAADIEAKNLAAKKSQLEYGIAATDAAHKDILAAASAADLVPIVARHIKAGDIQQADGDAILKQAETAPDFNAWRTDFGTRLMDMKDQLSAQHNEMTLAETTRHNRNQEGLTRRGQDITVRGQNMTDARTRESNAMATPSKVVGPILQKISQGQPLTAGEAAALDRYKAMDPLNAMISSFGGGSPMPQVGPTSRTAPDAPPPIVNPGGSRNPSAPTVSVPRTAPPRPAQAAPVKVKTVAEARALKPGTIFVTPDGQRKVR